MRNKKCIFNTWFWRISSPHKCAYCDNDATSILKACYGLRYSERDLCEECAKKWISGELYI